jgi:hypothetical protein
MSARKKKLKIDNSQISGGSSIAKNEEQADYELPTSVKESQEADIKMVKLQLLQHQMQSLRLS